MSDTEVMKCPINHLEDCTQDCAFFYERKRMDGSSLLKCVLARYLYAKAIEAEEAGDMPDE